jgi:hypothetical protein
MFLNLRIIKMKKLLVPQISLAGNPFPHSALSEPIAIDIKPWQDGGEKPTVTVQIAHDETHIYLKYSVLENSIIARTTANNGPVWQDSCVEFFIMPDVNDGIFYNFEFNCIGAKLLFAGKTRNERTPAEDAIIDAITTHSTLDTQPFEEQFGSFEWTLTVVIPVASFFQHSITSLKGKTGRANFYKCGDGLSKPHYLAWSNIETLQPDFHTPQYFGEILFE